MTPDPVLTKLAKFTPATVDPAELLLAVGRASACTPWFWKAAVASSLIVNVVFISLLVFRSPESPYVVPAKPAATPVLVQEPIPVVAPTSLPDPWSLQALNRVNDPDQLPKAVWQSELTHSGKPLTVLSARSGELD
ncbi:MAG: hypothetical protein C0467_03725 [Planctomycetaceae bacterium]|nr:hypothetical protein [Planctomycetaceae bacterium]